MFNFFFGIKSTANLSDFLDFELFSREFLSPQYIAPSAGNVWKVTSSVQYQEMLGFGAAITDSVGINLGTLSKDARENLLK